MELNEIKTIWQSYDAKLEQSLKLNQRCVELLQNQKAKSELNPIFWGRVTELVLHVIVFFLLLLFLGANAQQTPYAISAVMLMVFYVIAIVNCIKQITIIHSIDFSKDVVSIQSALAMLQSHILHYARLSVLCLPLFLAFPMVVSEAIKDLNLQYFADFDIMRHSNGNWYKAQVIATIAMLPMCIWIYTQATYKNIHKNWVKQFIEKSSGTGVRKAMEFVAELQELKK